jgi:hypothetical protein
MIKQLKHEHLWFKLAFELEARSYDELWSRKSADGHSDTWTEGPTDRPTDRKVLIYSF